jgi:hypothetical protein
MVATCDKLAVANVIAAAALLHLAVAYCRSAVAPEHYRYVHAFMWAFHEWCAWR